MFLGKEGNGRLLFLLTLLCLWTIIITGCSAASKDTATDFEGTPSLEYGEHARMGGKSKGNEAIHSASEPQSEENNLSRAKPRFVIRTGSLELTVPDTRKTVEKVEQMIADGDGMVSESNVYEFREGQYAAELSLRVPETRFDSFIARLQNLGEAANVHKSSEDVTLSYLDLEVRIKNLKAEEERLREILIEAKTVEEILKVEQELFRVRGEVEAMTTEFTYLQDQVAFSTIRLSIKEEVIDTQTISQKPFANMGKRMKEALFRSINFISSVAAFLLIALTTLLPVFLIIALIALLIVWLVRVNRRRKKNIPPGGHPPAVS